MQFSEGISRHEATSSLDGKRTRLARPRKLKKRPLAKSRAWCEPNPFPQKCYDNIRGMITFYAMAYTVVNLPRALASLTD